MPHSLHGIGSPEGGVTVYISLGSNLGDREEAIYSACGSCMEFGTIDRMSPLYRTEPLLVADQPEFLNAVVEFRTDLEPLPLLRRLHAVERAMGRIRTLALKNGPRIIDLDILLYADRVIRLPGLAVPHPRLWERGFALVPLLSIAPAVRDPVSGEPAVRALEKLAPEGVYFYAHPRYTRFSRYPNTTGN